MNNVTLKTLGVESDLGVKFMFILVETDNFQNRVCLLQKSKLL